MKNIIYQNAKNSIEKIVRLIIIISFAISFQMCSSVHNYRNQTNTFNKYLEEFGFKIPDEEHLYIIYSKVACSGCASQISEMIIEKIDFINKNNTTLVCTNVENIPEILIKRSTYIYDEFSEIDYLDLDLYNVTFIETKGNMIVNILSGSPKKIYELGELLNSYYAEDPKMVSLNDSP